MFIRMVHALCKKKETYIPLLALFILTLNTFAALAAPVNSRIQPVASVSGVVTDASSREPLAYVNVWYEGTGVGTMTDSLGRFSVPYHKGWTRLSFSLIGFKKQSVTISSPVSGLTVRMEMDALQVKGVSVKAKRKKYNRKNNPAVDLMRKVIAHKSLSDLKTSHDYFSYRKYVKRTLSFNEVSDKTLSDAHFNGKLSILKDRVETCPETGKLILPVSVDEVVTRRIYSKPYGLDKTITEGRKSTGLNDFFTTGDILTTMLEDVFSDIDIYKNAVYVLQNQFVSPLSSVSAISFYRYFIADTVMVGDDKCYEVTFTPANSQDFGFSGSLLILADSSYQVKRAELHIPHNNDVNFVQDMIVTQDFATLPEGGHVQINDNMIVEINVVGSVTKFNVKRTTHYDNFTFNPIPRKEFRFSGPEKTLADASMRNENWWNEVRPVPLSEKEQSMGKFLKAMMDTKGFKPLLFVAKAFIENFVETSSNPDKPSKFDFGPVNTVVSHNFVDGLRFRLSGQTTANLSPHLFARGYVAYGCKDQKFKGLGSLTYSFNRKDYLPREFPVNNLNFTYQYDDASPSDRFMPTDKDNVFTSLKWKSVYHMLYSRRYSLSYDKEWGLGLRLTTQIEHETQEPTADLIDQKLGSGASTPSLDNTTDMVRKMRTTGLTLSLQYQPGATYINTKQRRITTNHNAPIFSITHTAGLKGFLGGDYNYNMTEARIYKRLMLASWGRIDTYLKGGIEWNRVPFPLLIMPAANLSYIKERETFALVDNMEFLNDRYVSLMSAWDMNGKLFNRIPLLRKLKWREYIGVNMLWGSLSDKNNPFLAQNANDSRLFYFPGRYLSDGTYRWQSHVMDKNKPYIEWIVGIHNIFKIIHVEYVHRVNYIYADTHKSGFRIMMKLSF